MIGCLTIGYHLTVKNSATCFYVNFPDLYYCKKDAVIFYKVNGNNHFLFSGKKAYVARCDSHKVKLSESPWLGSTIDEETYVIGRIMEF